MPPCAGVLGEPPAGVAPQGPVQSGTKGDVPNLNRPKAQDLTYPCLQMIAQYSSEDILLSEKVRSNQVLTFSDRIH